ncbi:hypothetical protein ABPG74_010273 [Tetrahymena malaccensis]
MIQVLNSQTINLQYQTKRKNQIGSKGSYALCQALSSCTNLVTFMLLLGWNQIGEEGSTYLGVALANCKKLQSLYVDIRSNQIGYSGASIFFSALKNCANLSTLQIWFQNNEIKQTEEKLLKHKLMKIKQLVQYYK